MCLIFFFLYILRAFNLRPSDTPNSGRGVLSNFFFVFCVVFLRVACPFVILSSWHTSICMRLAWSIAYIAFYLFCFCFRDVDFGVRV